MQHGHAVLGREPSEVWAGMTADNVRRAVIEEMTGYWTWAVRRPWLWFSTDQVDLSVTTMLRARHTLATGELITKSAALAGEDATQLPARLVHGVRARRNSEGARPDVRLPLSALAAWRLTRRTIVEARADPLTSRG